MLKVYKLPTTFVPGLLVKIRSPRAGLAFFFSLYYNVNQNSLIRFQDLLESSKVTKNV